MMSDDVSIAKLTTVDNPYNPFTQFKEWYAYDMSMGYNTSSFLARICQDSIDLSLPDRAEAINNAIDEIVAENASGMYRKVLKNSSVNLKNFKEARYQILGEGFDRGRGV